MMRRSLKNAIVGFSILGGIIAFSASMFWLKGIRVGARTWTISADFEDASGLSERSPIKYRGILVGSVSKISITPTSVNIKLEIDKHDLILPKPVFAKIINSSLLGGDVEISLISEGKHTTNVSTIPINKNCQKEKILCNGDIIKGESISSIASLTSELENMVQQADKENIVSSLVSSTRQFDRTQRELEELILQAKNELKTIEPVIKEIKQASIHLKNILAAIDNPDTLQDIQLTATSARSLTKRIDTLGEEINRMIKDEELMSAVRSLTIGLGEFFNEVYPSKTNSY
tara:strand:- start:1515 stop:2381 length:867 start_codon:yes stop_codon:yes gene_type:complete